MSFDDLADELRRPGEANLLTVTLDSLAEPDASAVRLEDLALAAGLPVGQVNTGGEIRAAVDGLLSLVVGVLLVVGAVLAVIAVVGLAGTMSLGVMEQTREIGVLRAIGASNRTVRRLFVVQGLTIAAIGAVLGLVTSVPVTLALRIAISNGLIASRLPAGYSVVGIAIWVAVALVIGALGASRPAHTAARLTVRDTLAYE